MSVTDGKKQVVAELRTARRRVRQLEAIVAQFDGLVPARARANGALGKGKQARRGPKRAGNGRKGPRKAITERPAAALAAAAQD